jgi:hypothetical protein
MPVLDHKHLIKPNPDAVIWRYMDLFKFESLLTQSSLFFCRADKFSDPFEGSLPRKEAEHIKHSELVGELIGEDMPLLPGQKWWEPARHVRARSIRSFVINCWHINPSESDAMWKLYLQNKEGIAIQSTVKRLRECFASFDGTIYITKVRYIDYENGYWFDEIDYPFWPEDGLSASAFAPITHKRIAFAHEQELRVLQHFEDAINNDKFWNSNEIGRFIPCDIDFLVERIVLSPTADEIAHKIVIGLVEKCGAKLIIETSKLNQKPSY